MLSGALATTFLCFGQDDELLTLYSQAREAQIAGDYETATEKYQRIATLRPDMAEVQSNLGILHYQQKKFSGASIHFRKAIELKPSLEAPYFFLGVLSFFDRDYEEAIRYLNQAEKLGAPKLEVHLYRGYTYYAQSQYKLAARSFENAARSESKNYIDILYHLSKSYSHLADRYFVLLKENFPQSFFTHLARGHAHEIDKNWEKAQIEYGEALKQKPTSYRLKEKLTWISQIKTGISAGLGQSGSTDEIIDGQLKVFYDPPTGARLANAFRQYQNRISELLQQESEGQSAERFYLLGESYQVVSYLASLSVFERGPNSHRTHQLKGEYYEADRRDDDAIREYRRALALKPGLRDLHFWIGNLYWKKNRLEEAYSELMQELVLNPRHPEALYEVGDILYAQGKLEASREYFLRSLSVKPSKVEARLALEKIYTKSGQYDQALVQLQKAAEIAPEDSTPHYRMWLIYRRVGKIQDADAALQTFTKLKAKEDVTSAAR